MILRENVQRRIVVSSNVSGRDLGSVVEDIQAAVAQQLSMPEGYRVEYGGQFESLVPILMTALAAGLALIPLALSGGEAGSEIQTPMAIVILCGLTTSTLLNMFVVPTMYLRYGKV